MQKALSKKVKENLKEKVQKNKVIWLFSNFESYSSTLKLTPLQLFTTHQEGLLRLTKKFVPPQHKKKFCFPPSNQIWGVVEFISYIL